VPPSLNTALYRRLRDELIARRKALKWSQAMAAERVGLDQPTISKIETAERFVDLEEFVKFAKAYRMDPIEWFRKICG
jgi:transcriptional regulator with XRE-family HTH domain